jgi:hypothetical protein
MSSAASYGRVSQSLDSHHSAQASLLISPLSYSILTELLRGDGASMAENGCAGTTHIVARTWEREAC